MAGNKRKVLITGATGKQGGSAVRHMLGKGWNLTALTRDPKSKAAEALLEKGVEIVQGDMEDASSLDGCLRGVYGVYSVQDFWSAQSVKWRRARISPTPPRRRASSTSSTAPSGARNGIPASGTGRANGKSRNIFGSWVFQRRCCGPRPSWRITTSTRSKSESYRANSMIP